jgi:transcriptional regulator with XRE-family HTH domain
MRVYKIVAIAEVADLSPLTIMNIRDGKTMPTVETVRKLAAALGVDPGWMIDDSRGFPPKRVTPLGDLKQESHHDP